MGFGNTLRTVLEMDLAPFERSAKRSVTITRDMSDGMVKSAKASAQVFEDIFAAEAKLNDARVAQARAANESITAGQAGVAKSARASAAVFEELAAREADVAAGRVAQAEATNRSITMSQDLVSKSARESAAVFESEFAKQAGGWRGFVARITGGVSTIKKTLAGAGGGGLFGRFLGVSAVLGAFTASINRAQELRAEAERLGKPLDASVVRVAKLGAAFSNVKNAAVDVGVAILGAATSAGENIGSQIARLKGFFNGQSFAETDARIASAEASGANADRLEAELQDPAAARNIAERERLSEERRRKTLNDFDLLNQLEQDRDKLQAASLDKSKTLAQRTAAQVALQEKLNEIDAQRAAIDKDAADDRARADKEQADRNKDAADAKAKADADQKERDEDRNRREKEYADAVRDAAAAQARVAEAAKDLATANRDRVAFGVDEAASGKRGTSGEQRTAKRIADLEARARRAYDRGGVSSDRRDQQGNRISETGEQESSRLLREADELRNGLGNRLKSSDRDPLKAHKEALAESEKLLGELVKSLTAVEADQEK